MPQFNAHAQDQERERMRKRGCGREAWLDTRGSVENGDMQRDLFTRLLFSLMATKTSSVQVLLENCKFSK